MVGKLTLVKEDKFYLILVYGNALSEMPTQRIHFPYETPTESESLKKARDFGNQLSRNLNSPLEERI